MANRPDYVQLETGDDVTSVRDRLSFLRGKRVLLIWPEDGTVLTRKLDLVLIQRDAMRRAIRLGLVTHDPQVIRHARELDISTFETIGASERGRWRRGRGKVFTNRFQRPKDEPLPDDLKEVASRIYAEEDAANRKWRLLRRAVGILIFAAIAAAIGYVVLPSATVTLVPARSRLQALTTVIVDPAVPGIDIENRVIPATTLSVQIEDTGTVETSGSQPVENATASGSVIFINKTADAVTIPAGTLVTTSAGTPIQFRTTQDAQVAGGVGLQIETPIEALQTSSGAIGNVDSGTINTVIGPLADRVDVRNVSATEGGATRTRPVIAQADVDNLLFIVRQQLQTRAYLEMQSRLTATQCIIVDTVQIGEERDDWKTFSGQIGDVTDTLSLTMRVVVDALVVDEAFAQRIALAEMSRQLQPNQAIQADSVAYELGCESGTSRDESGRITFQIGGSGIVNAIVDSSAIQQQLAGLPVNDAMAYLVTTLPLQQGFAPQISLWPEGFPSLPLLAPRITIQFQEAPA